jgi:hypothetical protein
LERLLAGAAELDFTGKSKKETQLLMQVNIEDNFSGKSILFADVSSYFCRRY